MDPRGSAGKHSKAHYESPDGRTIWCGQSRIFTVLEGNRIRMWHPTRREVTCKPCIKKLEKHVAALLADLNGDQLEDIAAHVGTFTAKYPPEGMEIPAG